MREFSKTSKYIKKTMKYVTHYSHEFTMKKQSILLSNKSKIFLKIFLFASFPIKSDR